jgi:hypothetical protein
MAATLVAESGCRMPGAKPMILVGRIEQRILLVRGEKVLIDAEASWISKGTRALAMRCGRRTTSIMRAAVQSAPGVIESRFAAEPFCSTPLQAGQAA